MRKFAAPLVVFLLCVAFYWKLTLTSQYTFLDSPDFANLDLPRLQFQASAWRHLHIPLWDPYQWAGQPFLGQLTGAAYPANWLLGLFPFRDGKLNVTVVHWYLVLIHFQAALFCYILCREWKRSYAASIVGGLVFALGGFMGATDWPQILNGALWLPLVVLFLFRALAGRRPLASAMLSGAFLGVMWLSGHHEVPIYATAVLACVWLMAAAVNPARRRALMGLGMAAALSMTLAAAVQFLPTLEYGPLAKRWAGLPDPIAWNEPIPYTVHEHYSWSTSALPGIVTPRAPVHVDPFLGVAAFSLAVLGTVRGWRRLPQVRLLIFLAAAGLLLALASGGLFHGILYAALPVFGKARVPARALALFGFAAAPLAAYGMDALRRRSGPELRRLPAILAAAGCLFLAAGILGLRPANSSEQPLLTAFAALSAASLFAAWRARAITERFLQMALALLVLFEIAHVSGAGFTSRLAPGRPGHLDRLFQHNDIASFLRAQPGPVRVDVADADIPYNFGDWHGIPTLGGFTASATSNLLELERHTPAVQDLLGVSHYVGRSAPRPDLELVSGSASGLNVYRNPAALPRAWVVHSAIRAASPAEIRRRMAAPDFQPRRETLLLSDPPGLESCPEGGEMVRMRTTANPNRIRIDATMSCRGMVILSETAFPGWRATIDGHPSPIWEPFGALRGIVVEKGSHHIELSYRPVSAMAGGGMSLAGALLVFGIWFRTRKPASR